MVGSRPRLSTDSKWVFSRRQAAAISGLPSMAESPCRSNSQPPPGAPPTLPEGFHEPVSSPEGTRIAGHYSSREPRGDRIAVVPLDGSPPRLFSA